MRYEVEKNELIDAIAAAERFFLCVYVCLFIEWQAGDILTMPLTVNR